MAAVDELPIRKFVNQNAWESWLSGHHSSRGLWLKFSKKGAMAKSLTYQEALEVALCYGWIDSQKRSFDDQHFLQKFGPRGTRSIWSRINRSTAEQLIRDGRMQAAGLAAVDSAKQKGQWDKEICESSQFSFQLNFFPNFMQLFHAAQQRFYKLICISYKSCIVYKAFHECQDNGNGGIRSSRFASRWL